MTWALINDIKLSTCCVKVCEKNTSLHLSENTQLSAAHEVLDHQKPVFWGV